MLLAAAFLYWKSQGILVSKVWDFPISLAATIAGCRAILAGEVDALPEEAFYMIGTLEQVITKAQNV